MAPVQLSDLAQILAMRLGVAIDDIESVSASDRFVDDWGVDSFQLLQLSMVVEELADRDRSGEDVPLLETVGDAIRYYEQISGD